jgi:hypothetical protein
VERWHQPNRENIMAESPRGHDERNQNAGLEHKEGELQDPDRRPPHHEETVASPRRRGEAPIDSPHRQENPPQTIGPRERNNDAV